MAAERKVAPMVERTMKKGGVGAGLGGLTHSFDEFGKSVDPLNVILSIFTN
jgi:hypothetical protein